MVKPEVWGSLAGAFLAAIVGLAGAVWVRLHDARQRARDELDELIGACLACEAVAHDVGSFLFNLEKWHLNEGNRLVFNDPRVNLPDSGLITQHAPKLAKVDHALVFDLFRVGRFPSGLREIDDEEILLGNIVDAKEITDDVIRRLELARGKLTG